MTDAVDSKSMSKSHTLQVPSELVKKLWLKLRNEAEPSLDAAVAWRDVLACAAQWGHDQREPEIQRAADQELDACCGWLNCNHSVRLARELRAARRPSVSPVEQVRSRLACLIDRIATEGALATVEPIRECLEILDKLEAQQ